MESKLTQKNKLWFLSLIIFIGFSLRFWQLNQVPPSPSLDEVSIGYNAYSILKTGADEYGTKFPLVLRAYDDWRPALYVYLVIPFVKMFGLTAVSVRLPSVILSVISVIAVYFLTKKVFEKSKNSEELGLISSLFLAISSWHVYISRLGHEANAGLAFMIIGFTLLFYKKNIIGTILLILSFMSYQSEKIIIPIIFITFALLFHKEVWKRKLSFVIGFLVTLPILIPFVTSSLKPEAMIRFRATNVFSAEQQKFNDRALKLSKAVEEGNIVDQIINNRRIVAFELFSSQYFSHFKPAWLFTNSGNESHKVPNLGLLYVRESFLIIFGLFYFYKIKISWKKKIFLLIWLLIAPIPAAITTGAPHAMRSYTFLPIWQILGACGLILIVNLIEKYKKIIYIGSFLLVFVSIFYFYKNYFVVFPEKQSDSFQYSLSKAIPYVLENQDQYGKIIFSNEDSLYQSYMFFLFYSKYDPKLYQEQGGTVSGGYAEIHKIGKFEFRPIEWSKEGKLRSVLYIGNMEEVKGEILEEFKDLNNMERIKITNG